MKIFKKLVPIILIITLFGIPLYAAGRIIIPNWIKEKIVSNLPLGSQLSIEQISSEANLTIVYSGVKFIDSEQNYIIFFPLIKIKPRANIQKPFVIEASEAIISAKNGSLKLNSVQVSIFFSQYKFKAPKVSIEIDKIEGDEGLAADNIILLFAGLRGEKKILSVDASSAKINYNTPKGVAKIDLEGLFFKGTLTSDIELSFNSEKSIIDLSLIEPFNDGRIINSGNSKLALNLNKKTAWRAPFKLESNNLFNSNGKIVEKTLLTGIWEWGKESEKCSLNQILELSEKCGRVKNLRDIKFQLADPSGHMEVIGNGICVTPNANCLQKIDAEIKTQNTTKIFSKVMTSGFINPLFGGVVLGGLLSYPVDQNTDFDHKVKFEMTGSKILINNKPIF